MWWAPGWKCCWCRCCKSWACCGWNRWGRGGRGWDRCCRDWCVWGCQCSAHASTVALVKKDFQIKMIRFFSASFRLRQTKKLIEVLNLFFALYLSSFVCLLPLIVSTLYAAMKSPYGPVLKKCVVVFRNFQDIGIWYFDKVNVFRQKIWHFFLPIYHF